jgi:predicted glycosyltransferase
MGTPRIQLHSHDSYGLGHLRRTTTLAEAIRRELPQAEVLITTGSPVATAFPQSAGIDIVKLPSVTKNASGQYVARSLGLPIDALVRLRQNLLLEVQQSFRPHILIVDHQILGLAEELLPVLQSARNFGTRTILGVRDIIDAPEIVAREWGRPVVREALRSMYERVCVYGDPQVFDPREQYPIPAELRERLEFVGYVARDATPPPAPRETRERPHVLAMVGGGEDGGERIDTVLEALALGPCPFETTVVLGPLSSHERAREFKRRARALENVTIQTFHADIPHLLARSDAVVSMAGYNSVVEVLSSGVPAIFCPRSFPRREQLIRAERLEALGLASCLASPSAEELRAALLRELTRGPRRAPLPRMDGANSLARVVAQELAAGSLPLSRTQRS